MKKPMDLILECLAANNSAADTERSSRCNQEEIEREREANAFVVREFTDPTRDARGLRGMVDSLRKAKALNEFADPARDARGLRGMVDSLRKARALNEFADPTRDARGLRGTVDSLRKAKALK